MQSGVPGADWRPAENFHITLAFIGHADGSGCRDIDLALGEIAFPEFEIRLRGAGSFGGAKPRALWIGVSESEELLMLQKKVAGCLRRAGVKLEARRYVPHVTLAYLNRTPSDNAAAWASHNSLFSSALFKVRNFHLYESHLGRGGAGYEVLASYALSSSR